MYKFSEKEVSMMNFLGYTTDVDKEMCYEGFEEAYWEQRANGIFCEKDFTEWLARRVAWEGRKKTNQIVLTKKIS